MCMPIVFGLVVIADAMRSPPVLCTMSDNRVYVAGFGDYLGGVIRPRGGGSTHLIGGHVFGSERCDYPIPVGGGKPAHPMTPFCWRLVGGRLHYLGYGSFVSMNQIEALQKSCLGSIPVSMMPKSNAPEVKNWFLLSDLYQQKAACPRHQRGSSRLSYEVMFQASSADREAILDAAKARRAWPYPHSDFLVDPSGGYEELILGKDVLTCWKSVPKGENEEFGWEKGDVVGVDWRGPFVAAASGKDRYVANDRGELYLIPRPAGPGARLRKVWGSDAILLLAADPDSGRTFAFTSCVFFEISNPAVVRDHSIAVTKKTTSRENLEVAILCCRAVEQSEVVIGPDDNRPRPVRVSK